MKTFAEQQEFFEKHRQAMQEAALRDGAAGVAAFVAAFEDALERRVLCVFARQAVQLDRAFARDLDLYVGVARAGIEECLAQSRELASSDPDLAARCKDTANVISYNLAADLADCWPDDGLRRGPRHFEVGLQSAKDCIGWREELDKPPYPHSIAWWARGMHELSLGRIDDAVDSFGRSTEFARRAADDDESAFGVVLGRGYEAIARGARGDAGAEDVWSDATGIFESQKDDSERADDAKFGLEQLRIVRDRYWASA